MMQVNEDEGFAQQPYTEYTEFNYSPCFNLKPTQHRPYLNPLKLKPLSKSHSPPEAYINNSLQKLLNQRFAANHSPIYRPLGFPINNLLTFDSAFESGNLEYVVPHGNAYELYIKPDTNTMTHFQWFYFKVKNKKAAKVKFIVKNFLKAKMSYLQGLRPYHRPVNSHQKHYEQIPNDVIFCKSEEENEAGYQYYELIFEYNFESANDQVEFCSQPPYSYSRYCKIYKILPFSRTQISRTVLGNKIDAFVVNQFLNSNTVVVVMARQHPGQTVGSWMMQGFVNKLIQTSTNITWILLPMVNIDGVILGNNRTGVQGYDFNRHWYIDEETNRYHLFPQLKGIIAYFKSKKKEFSKKVKIFIDFHGHSSQQNVFAYGPPHYKNSQYFQLSRILPYLISKRNTDFSISQCSYCIQPSKKGCSRSIFLYKFGFTYSYTIQSSFGIYRGRRVNEKDMIKIGGDVFKSVIEFVGMLNETKENSSVLKNMINLMKEEVVEIFRPSEGYDSDSDNQDQNSLIRQGFQQKLVTMLTKEARQLESSLFDKIAKKRQNTTNFQKQSKISKPNSTPVPHSDQKRRMRTQEDRKSSFCENSNTFLPRVRLGERSGHSSKNKVVDLCDLDRLSLQEMKQRLMKMKHSQLGKRILIINSHQNS